MAALHGLCVVHLVWAPLGLEPFRRFLASYRLHPGGTDHRLIIVYNGFAPGADLTAYRRELAGLTCDELVLPRPVQDISAYFAAAAWAQGLVVCFLNSYCVLLDPLWLHKLHACLELSGVGLVGATGSWGSLLSYVLLQNGRPSAYAEVYGGEEPDLAPLPPARSRLRQLLRPLKHRWAAYRHLRHCQRWYTPFPAYHLRTNAFMLRRETLLSLQRPIRTKADAFRFESGRDSLMAQVLASGQSVRVVGKDGVGYEKERWPESETFWQGSQDNLLVADNQTTDYERTTPPRQWMLSRYAWGTRARAVVASVGRSA